MSFMFFTFMKYFDFAAYIFYTAFFSFPELVSDYSKNLFGFLRVSIFHLSFFCQVNNLSLPVWICFTIDSSYFILYLALIYALTYRLIFRCLSFNRSHRFSFFVSISLIIKILHS